MNIALIVAGGSGQRMNTGGLPKQFLEVNGKPVIIHTLENFEYHREIDKIIIGCIDGYIPHMEALIKQYGISKVIEVIPGGSSRLETIWSLLQKTKEKYPSDSIVLIHDGVRPIISESTISNVITSAKEKGNGVTCTSSNETIVVSENGEQVKDIPYRKHAYGVQSPQCFRLGDIIGYHERIRKINPTYENIVDSCTLLNALGEKVHLVQGNRGNIKITTPEDVFVLKGLLQYRESLQIMGEPIGKALSLAPEEKRK